VRLNRQQIKHIMALDRHSDTFYVVDFQQQMEFWDWCTDHGVSVRFEGTWTDQPVFRVVSDPSPTLTALRWS
jgi:hypothetical protein